MGIVRELARSYREHDGFSLAANISFFAILSVIPILMITMSVAGFVLGSSQDLFAEIVSAVTVVLPKGGDEFATNLNGIISGRSQIGGIGVVILLFIASLLFSSIEHALDRIFQSVKKRNFLHSRGLAILLVFGITFLLFLPTMVSLFGAALQIFNIGIPLERIATSKVFFILLAIASFTAGVVIIPNHSVSIKYGLVGGVFFAIGISIAKFLFRWYIAHSFDRYNLIYGSLTALVVAVVWIYYLANILLLASELVAVLQRRYNNK